MLFWLMKILGIEVSSLSVHLNVTFGTSLSMKLVLFKKCMFDIETSWRFESPIQVESCLYSVERAF